jgi:hypothetical protein
VKEPDGKKIDASFIDRDKNPVVKKRFDRIRHRHGLPSFGYTYWARPADAFRDGYRHGYRDGFRDGRHFGSHWRHRHRPTFLFFYSNFYFDDPFYTGFWYSGYYPSIYHYYGWFPRWCNAPSIIVYNADPYPFYGYGYHRPLYYYDDTPRLDESGADRAVADIRRAWLDADIDRFAYYLRNDEKISIYFDNEYSYSLSDADYYSMTLDAMSTLNTVAMDFDDPVWINQNEIFFTGRHVFYDPDDEKQTVYVSYRLHRYDGHWYIIGVGSSPSQIQYDYADFRYNR